MLARVFLWFFIYLFAPRLLSSLRDIATFRDGAVLMFIPVNFCFSLCDFHTLVHYLYYQVCRPKSQNLRSWIFVNTGWNTYVQPQRKKNCRVLWFPDSAILTFTSVNFHNLYCYLVSLRHHLFFSFSSFTFLQFLFFCYAFLGSVAHRQSISIAFVDTPFTY